MGNAKRAVIVCSGPIDDDEYFKAQLSSEDFVICADGGWDHCQRCGIRPSVVIGDLDSCREKPHEVEVIRYPCEKDDTDLSLCLKYAAEKGFHEAVIFGGLGGRIDHTFANLQLLVFALSLGLRCRLESREVTVLTVSDGSMILQNCHGKTVSIFSNGDRSSGITLEGFQYPLNDAELTNTFPLGISNIVTSDAAIVRVENGTLFVMLSHE